jgi:hypothetical protein
MLFLLNCKEKFDFQNRIQWLQLYERFRDRVQRRFLMEGEPSERVKRKKGLGKSFQTPRPFSQIQ